MTAKILLAQGFEEIEAITIIDLLRRAGIGIITVSVTGMNEVKGGHDIAVVCDNLLEKENFENTEMLILPGGGVGVNNLSADERVIELVRKFKNSNKTIAAICAAPFVLEKAGILNNKNITCFPTWKEKIKSAKYVDKSVVVDDKIITGNGVGGAIDFSLKIVELFKSREDRENLAESILYKG